MAKRIGHWKDDPNGYRPRVNKALVGRDALLVMAETGYNLREFVDLNTANRLRARPIAEKRTPLEIVGHWVDAEWAYAHRIRTVLTSDVPSLTEMQQDRWVEIQRYNEREPRQLATSFSALPEENLLLWRGLTTRNVERIGIHDRRGPEPIRVIFNHLAMHDLHHLDPMQRYLSEIG